MSDIAPGTDASLHEVMSTMRAMRRLKPDPVPRELLERLVEAATFVACYDMSVVNKHLRSNWQAGEMAEAASVYPAVENLLLTARALGLAATLTTWHLFFEDDFKKVLGIPKGVKTFAAIPVGYPRGKFGPVRRRPVDEVIHWEGW